MKLIFIVVLVAIFVICAPFVILWNSGRLGPAFAILAFAGILAGGGYWLIPGPETWPADKSGLQQIAGTVTKATKVWRGSSDWYELELTGPDKYLTVPGRVPEDDIRNVIGKEIHAGCYKEPEYACRTVWLECDGKVLIDYAEVLQERQSERDQYAKISQWLFIAAGVVAAFGLGLMTVRARRATA
jgi:hypothetical protein